MSDKDDDPIRYAPGFQEQLNKIVADDPEAADVFRDFFAKMRQAHHAWQEGRYASFDDAIEAITGERPTPIDVDDEDIDLE